jgi:hypothetical protein
VELGAEYRFGGSVQNSYSASRRFLDESGQVKSPLAIRQIIVDAYVRNPAGRVLSFQDSLALTPSQVQALRVMSAEYEERVTAPLEPLLRYIAKEGKNLTNGGFAEVSNAAFAEISPIIYSYGDRISKVLTAEQRLRLTMLTKRRP